MKRMTTEKPAGEMNMVELAHNCMYAKDRWAWYRDYDSDMDLRDFIRRFSVAEGASKLPDDNEILDIILMDDLQYGINDPNGRTALVYRLMWAMADLREALMGYEDISLNPEEIKEALKRREPKKPKVDKRKYHEDYICPCCAYRFISKDETGWFSGMCQKFCPDCGQSIDWEN